MYNRRGTGGGEKSKERAAQWKLLTVATEGCLIKFRCIG